MEYWQRPLTPGGWAGFLEGAGTVAHGFRYLNRHPKLWRYALLPLLLNVVISAITLVGLIAGVVWAIRRLHPEFPEGTLGIALEILSGILLIALAVALAFATWLILQAILCGYFYSRLAYQVELRLGARPEELTEVGFWAQAVDALRTVLTLIGINVGLLALHCVPVLGSIVAFAASFYFDAVLLGMECLDYPLSMRGKRRDEKVAFVRRHRPHTLGLGAVILGFGMIPILGAVLMVGAVVGAVLLHRRATRVVA